MAKQAGRNLLRCLAIQQPWAWAVCAGVKTVENRTQPTPYQGQIAILASQTQTNVNRLVRESRGTLQPSFFTFGAIIGVATLTRVVELDPTLEDNPDAIGPICWIFENARFLPHPIKSNGKLNLYSLTEEESEAVRAQLPGLQPQPVTDEGRAWTDAYRGDPFDRYVERGRSYCDLERYEDVIRNYDAALRLQPGNIDLVVARGAARSQVGSFEDALADFDRGLREQPRNVTFLAFRGEVYHKLGRFDEAIRDYDAALKIEPDAPEILLGRVDSYLGKKDAAQAIRDCTQVIQSNPDNALAYMLRREAHLLRNDTERAEADLQAATALDPDGVAGWDEEAE